MGGVLLSGAVFLPPTPGPPFSQLEGTTGGGAGQSNVWIGFSDSTSIRLTPNVDPTCTPIPCSDEYHTPRMNPAGNQVAVFDFDPDDGAISLYVVPTDGSATYPLSPSFRFWDDPGGDWANHPSWHSGGGQILFTSSGPDSPYVGGTLGGKVMRVTYPGAVATTLWTPDVQSPTQREEAFRPTFSPDGTKIAFLVNIQAGGGGTLSRQGLWTMDADGSNDAVIDNWNNTNADRGYLYSGTQLAWSNDSEWIAYVDGGFSGGGTFSVYKIRPDGTDKTLLKEGNGIAANGVFCRIGWGAWLDDDSEIIVSADSPGVGWEIWSVLTDGSETEALLIADPDGPVGTQNFETCYRLDDRIYWTFRICSGGDTLIHSCALDGSDTQTYYDGTTIDACVAAGSGFEWL